MNKFITAIKNLDFKGLEAALEKEPKWITWAEEGGKNALHYLGGVTVGDDKHKADVSLEILKMLLEKGMDINSIHKIVEGCEFFPATPLWYAYTRGRNEALFKYLLAQRAHPENCMFAIAWYDDAEAATLFKSYGANIEALAGTDTPFMGAYKWKRYNIAEWFLKNGANVNAADEKGNTTLFYAVKRKDKIEQIKMLLQYGADCNKQNNEGVSPKKLAELNRQRNILREF
jgi:hypothetical protein